MGMMGARGKPSRPNPSSSMIERDFCLCRRLAPGQVRGFSAGEFWVQRSVWGFLAAALRFWNHRPARMISTTTTMMVVIPMMAYVGPPGFAVDVAPILEINSFGCVVAV